MHVTNVMGASGVVVCVMRASDFEAVWQCERGEEKWSKRFTIKTLVPYNVLGPTDYSLS